MKKIIAIIILSIFSFSSNAQKTVIKPLQIGDKVPDAVISNISNYKTTVAHVSDFKGKLLILDFWGVHCTSCIAEMPHMEALQKEFGNKIQVLLVTQDSKEAVNELLKRSAFVRNIHLPFVVADTILSKYFPYHGLGLHVWIDAHGLMAQNTSKDAYSINDVRKFLNGEQIKLTQRKDIKSLNIRSILPFLGGENIKQPLYFSFIAKTPPEIIGNFNGGIQDSATKKLIGLWNGNVLIPTLFNTAYFGDIKVGIDKTIWEVNDSSFFTRPKEKPAEWDEQHSYCYEFKVPVEKADQLYAFMQQDLERVFNITGKIEKRKLKCLILIRTPAFDTLVHKNSNNSKLKSCYDDDAFRMDSIVSGNNFDFKKLTVLLKDKYFNDSHGDCPVVDETNYTSPVELKMHGSYDYETLRKELQKNGLDLLKGEREFTCLVLREKGYKELSKN